MAEDSESRGEGVSQKTEQELVKLYKRRLENWREVLTHLSSLITWEKPYFPGIITGVITLIFIMLWYFDPSVLTTLSIFGIIACVLDYVVPILSASFFDSSKWTGARERKYEEICYELVTLYMRMKTIWDSARQVKETKPYLTFASLNTSCGNIKFNLGVLGTLVMTAWIGNLINNLFLTYLIVLLTSLLPGVKSHSLVQQNLSKAMAMVKGMAGGDIKKKN